MGWWSEDSPAQRDHGEFLSFSLGFFLMVKLSLDCPCLISSFLSTFLFRNRYSGYTFSIRELKWLRRSEKVVVYLDVCWVGRKAKNGDAFAEEALECPIVKSLELHILVLWRYPHLIVSHSSIWTLPSGTSGIFIGLVLIKRLSHFSWKAQTKDNLFLNIFICVVRISFEFYYVSFMCLTGHYHWSRFLIERFDFSHFLFLCTWQCCVFGNKKTKNRSSIGPISFTLPNLTPQILLFLSFLFNL